MVLEDRWLRETYVDLLIEYAAKNKDIVILEADLMKAGEGNGIYRRRGL